MKLHLGFCRPEVRAGVWVGVACVVSSVTWALAATPAGEELRRDATVGAIARVMPAVVNIGTETVIEVRDPFEPFLREFWGPYYRRRPAETQYCFFVATGDGSHVFAATLAEHEANIATYQK